MHPVALVTGASSGIGMELARLHAARGGDLVLVARRQDRLEALKHELESAYAITATVIAKDLSVPAAAEELYHEVTTRGIRVDYLINNAGFGGHGLLYQRDWSADRAMINLNVLALTALTRLFVADMVQRNRGRILNLGSVAGFLPGPLQAVYYSTKAFVLSFSEALANELAATNVTVTVLCPASTATEFMQTGHLEGTRLFRFGVASARQVASYGYDAMLRGKTVAVPGLTNKFIAHALLRLLPRRVAVAVSRAALEKV